MSKNYSKEQIGFALNKATLDPKIDPYKFTVGKLIAYIDPQSDLSDEAIEAWENCLKYLRTSWKGKPEFSIATEKAISAVGGWERVGSTDLEKLDFVKNSFISSYKGFRSIHEKNETLKLFEADNEQTKQIGETIDGLLEGARIK